MKKIIPSIASSNLLEIGKEIDRVKVSGYLHLDIEDGNFSPFITFGTELVEMITHYCNLKLDAHLMVTDSLPYIDSLCHLGVTHIASHIENTLYPSSVLYRIHQHHCNAGLALNYKTTPEEIIPYIDQLDYVLLQTTEAGDPEAIFREYSFDKIRKVRSLLPSSIELWVDGGIQEKHLNKLQQLGVDCAIMGRTLFESTSPTSLWKELAQKYLVEE